MPMIVSFNIVHLLAIVCVALVTYLARYLPLKYGYKIGKGTKMVEVLRLCTIAVLTSLIILSVMPTFFSHNMENIVPAILGMIIGTVLARKLRNVGLVTLIGLGVYLLSLKLISIIT